MQSRDTLLERITCFFSALYAFTKLSNFNGRPNVNSILENLFTQTFNILIDEKGFRCLDPYFPNYPAIDIIDECGKTGIQVTSEDNTRKIKGTINLLLSHNIQLDRVIVLIIVPKKRKGKIPLNGIRENTKIEVWDLDSVIKEVRKLENEKLQELGYLFETEFPMLQGFIEEIEIRKNLSPGSFIKDITIDKYWPRKVSLFSNIEDTSNGIRRNNLDKEDILNALLTHKRVVLVGEPGLGKTTELHYVAIALAEEHKYFPIICSLSRFDISQKIEDNLPKNWKAVPKNRLSFIFDGLDEVSSSNLNTLVLKLLSFCDNYPKALFLFSCRSSIFSNVIEGKFDSFKTFLLRNLDWTDITSYANKFHKIDGEDLLSVSHRLDLMRFAENPFYLDLMCETVKEKGKITGSKAEIIKNLLQRRIDHDFDIHFKGEFLDKVGRNKIHQLLQEIATILTIQGSSRIDNNELERLAKTNELKILRKLLIFRREETSSNIYWYFEHNNFRDYFCAEKLKSLTNELVKKLICHPETNKIKRNWYDSLSLFLNVANPESELFKIIGNLILENEFEILILVEKSRIPEAQRFEILRRKLEYFKNKNLWYSSKWASESRLAEFCQSSKSFDYLLEEIVRSSHLRRHQLNCIFILKEFTDLSKSEKEAILSFLMPILKENSNDHYFTYELLTLFGKLRIHSEETIDNLFSNFGKRENQYIRAGMYVYILHSEEIDRWVDYLLEGLLINENESEDRSEVRLADETILLIDCFRHLKKVESYEAILTSFLNNSDFLNKFEYDELLKIILPKCVEVVHLSEALFEYVFSLMLDTVNIFTTSNFPIFIDFFRETKTMEKALKRSLTLHRESLNSNGTGPIAFFLDDSTFHELLPAIDSGELPFEALESVFHTLRIVRPDFCNIFKDRVKDILGREIAVPKENEATFDFKERRAIQLQVWFQAKDLKDEIIRILGNLDPWSLKTLNELPFTGDLADRFGLELYHTAKKVVRDIGFGITLDRNLALTLAKDEDYLFTLFVGRIIEKIQNKSEETSRLNEEEIEFLKNWFERNIGNANFEQVDFRNAAQINSNLNKARYLTYLFKEFGFKCDDSLVLDMLAFCNGTFGQFETVTIDDIIKRVGIEKTEKRIIDNIKGRKPFNWFARTNHFQYAFKNHWEFLYEPIFETITDLPEQGERHLKPIDDYFRFKNDPRFILPFFGKFGDEVKKLILEKIDGKNRTIELENFVEHLCEQDLSPNLESELNNLLIRMGKIKGLQRSIDWIKRNQKNPFNENRQQLNHFDDINALGYFLELLRLSYEKGIESRNKIDTIWGLVRLGLLDLAEKSEDYANKIIIALEKFIGDNKDTIEDVGYNFEIIEEIKSNQIKQEAIPVEISFKEARKVYREIFE